eukprot:3499119-Prymnesium_polylepis.1
MRSTICHIAASRSLAGFVAPACAGAANLHSLSFFSAFESRDANWVGTKRATDALYESLSMQRPRAALRGSGAQEPRRLCVKTTLFLRSRSPWPAARRPRRSSGSVSE